MAIFTYSEIAHGMSQHVSQWLLRSPDEFNLVGGRTSIGYGHIDRRAVRRRGRKDDETRVHKERSSCSIVSALACDSIPMFEEWYRSLQRSQTKMHASQSLPPLECSHPLTSSFPKSPTSSIRPKASTSSASAELSISLKSISLTR